MLLYGWYNITFVNLNVEDVDRQDSFIQEINLININDLFNDLPENILNQPLPVDYSEVDNVEVVFIGN